MTGFDSKNSGDLFVVDEMTFQAGMFGDGRYATLPKQIDNKILSLSVVTTPLIQMYTEVGFEGEGEDHLSATSSLKLPQHNSIVVRNGTWAAYTEVYGGEGKMSVVLAEANHGSLGYLLHPFGGPSRTSFLLCTRAEFSRLRERPLLQTRRLGRCKRI